MSQIQLTSALLQHPRPSTSPSSKGRLRYNQSMRLVRRLHLYTGLFMTPWVFLYGMTALLFNHPGAFPDREIRAISPSDSAGTPLADFPRPAELARRVVDAINAAGDEDADDAVSRAYRLVRSDEATYSRDYSATVTAGGRSHSMRLDLETRAGSVRSTPTPRAVEAHGPATAPFAKAGGLRVGPSLTATLDRSLPVILSRLGLPTTGIGGNAGDGNDPERDAGRRPEPPRGARPESGKGGGPGGGDPQRAGRVQAPAVRATAPELSFFMEGRGKVWDARYSLQTGALSGQAAGSPSAAEPLSIRRFLLRLHMAHGFPGRFDVRWIWAVAVDAMFLSMVGWGITGLLMWWQMKNVRKIGTVVLVASAIVATILAIGMHRTMTS